MNCLLPIVLWGTVSPAEARPSGWFTEGMSLTSSGVVAVPLLRNPLSGGVPLVEVQRADGSAVGLAAIDLGQGWTLLGWDVARRLGVKTESTNVDGATLEVGVVPELRVGALTLKNVPVQIQGRDTFVLGVGAMPGLSTAILPSEGEVRFATGDAAPGLVAAVGRPVVAERAEGAYTALGEKRKANGLSWAIPGEVAGAKGLLQVRTAEPESWLTAAAPAEGGRRHEGEVHRYEGARLGDLALSPTWWVRNESLVDGRAALVGALGYDQLAGLDLALDARTGAVAWRPANKPRWTDARAAELQRAQQAHKAAGLDQEAVEVGAPPRMGFGPPAPPAPKVDPAATLHERAIAQALWNAGSTDAAIRHSARAAELAGEQCLAHLELGERRLQAAGTLRRQSFVMDLVAAPLRRAGTLWEAFVARTPAERQALQSRPELGTVQDPACARAWGLLMAAEVSAGEITRASALARERTSRDPAVALAQGLSLLARKQPETAAIPLRGASSTGLPEVVLALAWANAAMGREEPVLAVVDAIPQLPDELGLVAAFSMLDWGEQLHHDGGATLLKRLLAADPGYLPAQVVALSLGKSTVDGEELAQRIGQARVQSAGHPQVEVLAVLVKGLQGSPDPDALKAIAAGHPPRPSLYLASALLHTRAGRPEQAQAALDELALRFPMLHIERFGLPVPGKE